VERVAQRDVADVRQHVALVRERGDGHAPALVLLAHEVLDRHADVVEERLVELRFARDLPQRAHGDARRLHVDEQEADALVLGGRGIGPHEEEAPVGDVPHARPHLLPVDDVMVAVAHGARLEIREVGARVRLGKPLAPHVISREDALEKPRLLGRRPVLHERGPEHAEPAAVDELR
jgi:hypothetical protein